MEEKKRILVADDDLAILELMVDILSDYEVITASHGQAAIDILKVKSVDLVITDLIMPQVDGLGVIDYIKNIMKNKVLPIVIITGAESGRKETSRQGILEKLQRQTVVDDVLSKPFSPQTLKYLVRNIFLKPDEL